MELLTLILLLEFGMFIVFFIFLRPRNFILFFFLTKPALDYFAESGITIAGLYISTNYIGGVLVPLCLLAYVLVYRRNLGIMPYKGLIVAFIIINVLSFLVQREFTIGAYAPSGTLFRVLSPICFYFAIPFILEKESDIVLFLKMIVFSGIFPMIMGFLQLVGVIHYERQVRAFGTLTLGRLTGGYHGPFSLTLPLIIAIFAILFFLYHKKHHEEDNKPRFVYILLLVSYAVIIFFTYHRMSYIVVLTAVLLWFIYSDVKFKPVFLAIMIAVIVYFGANFISNLFYDIYQPFDPRSNLYTGQALTGRFWLWRALLDNIAGANLFQKLLGVQIISRHPHNDYIRILYSNGVFGLISYLLLLGVIGFRVFRSLRVHSDDRFVFKIAFISVNIFLAYIFASITLAITIIPNICWFFWTFAGLLFYRSQQAEQQLGASIRGATEV